MSYTSILIGNVLNAIIQLEYFQNNSNICHPICQSRFLVKAYTFCIGLITFGLRSDKRGLMAIKVKRGILLRKKY